MIRDILVSLALSFIMTLMLELGFYLLVSQFGYKDFKLVRKRCKKDLLLVMLVNLLTNPVVVLLYWIAVLFTKWNTAIVIIPLELFAIVVEGYYYKKYGRDFKYPCLFSLTANMCSFWIGVLIQSLL